MVGGSAPFLMKILAGLLVQKDVILRDRGLPQGGELAVLVLFPRADPDIAVNVNRSISLRSSLCHFLFCGGALYIIPHHFQHLIVVMTAALNCIW